MWQDGNRYFWTRKNIRSAVSNWSRYLARVFELADIEDGHSHRFRDTCAVELLLTGASVEDVASILGNTPQEVARHTLLGCGSVRSGLKDVCDRAGADSPIA